MIDLSSYVGQWVALIDNNIVGADPDPEEALRQAGEHADRHRTRLRYVEVLEGEPLPLAPLLEQIRPLLTREGQPIYLVGGAVRDALLGRTSHDLDFVLPRHAIELAFRVADAIDAPAYVLDRPRDTGRVVLAEQDTMLDFARFRGTSLEDDLRDRDFTINALALPATAEGRESVIDPTGGLRDLSRRELRLTQPLALRSDPLRTLRAVRLAYSLDFALPAETREAVAAAAPLLDQVSAERQRDELLKILLSERAEAAMGDLQALGLLPLLLPEVAALVGVEQSAPHRYDVFEHTLRVLGWLRAIEALIADSSGNVPVELAGVADALVPYKEPLLAHLGKEVDGGVNGSQLLRLGALLHDVGKRETQTVEENGRIRFFEHSEVGAKLAAQRLRHLCLSREAVGHVQTIVAQHMRPLLLADAQGDSPSRRATFRYFRDTGSAGLDVGLLALADHLGTYGDVGDDEAWSRLVQLVGALFATYFERQESVVAPPPVVSGGDLMRELKLQPGPEIGRLLRLLQEAQAAGEVTTAAEALALAREAHAQKRPG